MKNKVEIKSHFDKIANKYDVYKKRNSFYYKNLKNLLRNLIPPNKVVLEVGTGTGDLLKTVKPKIGYGFDISSKMIIIANSKNVKKNISFSTIWPTTKFEYVFMSDVIEHLDNHKKMFINVEKLMGNSSRFIITMANPIWEPVLMVAEWLKLKMPEGPHNRITKNQISRFLEKGGLKVLKHDYALLVPIQIPFVTKFANKYLGKVLKRLSFIEYFIISKV